MEITIIVILFFLFITSVILPWINFRNIKELAHEINDLKIQLKQIFNFLNKEGVKLPNNIKADADNSLRATLDAKNIDDALDDHNDATLHNNAKTSNVSLERQFGTFLPVWIGAIALALAGFFMVKYSIENNLLSPQVRVMLGITFGIVLLCVASLIRTKPEFANGRLIAQALSGAGIADLYVCIFAATSIYDLVPIFIGFAGMAAVTASAVTLSLRHGMPIALLGMVGGFITPALFSSKNPQAPILFIYLYFVIMGLMVVIRKKSWWWLSIPTILLAFSWVCLWLFGNHFAAGDTLYLCIFLMAVSLTVVFTSKNQYQEDRESTIFKAASLLNYLTLGGAILLTGYITSYSGFGMLEWGLFGLLAIASLCLAFFNQKLYGLFPWLSMVTNVIMIAYWNIADKNTVALVISIFGVIYILGGYLLQLRSKKPLLWAVLTASASLGYYFLGYYKLRHSNLLFDIPIFWESLALAFSGVGVYALVGIMKEMPKDHPQKQMAMATYAWISTAFLSIFLMIKLPYEFLSVALSSQLLATAWINSKVEIKALRYIVSVLAWVVWFLIPTQIVFLFMDILLVQPNIHVTILQEPIIKLGLPALFFTLASYLLRQQKDDKLVYYLEISSIAFTSIMLYYIVSELFHSNANFFSAYIVFFERCTITNILFLYGIVCLWVGRNYLRKSFVFGGIFLSYLAIFRVIWFELTLYNPLFYHQSIGELVIFNGLLLSYGLPILLIWQAANMLSKLGRVELSNYCYGFILLFSFVFISTNIRQIFQGTYLDGYYIGNVEIYAYSLAWLFFAVALLFGGTLRKDKMTRVASLIIMILTAGKVFIFDVSALDGILRVLSFFGLGVSLLSISWFYTRFVFSKD